MIIQFVSALVDSLAGTLRLEAGVMINLRLEDDAILSKSQEEDDEAAMQDAIAENKKYYDEHPGEHDKDGAPKVASLKEERKAEKKKCDYCKRFSCKTIAVCISW